MSLTDRIFSALAIVATLWMLAWTCSGTPPAAGTSTLVAWPEIDDQRITRTRSVDLTTPTRGQPGRER